MLAAIEILRRLQQKISLMNDLDCSVEYTDRVYFAEVNDLVDIEYYGKTYDEPYETFIQSMSTPEIAGSLRSLTLRGPDEGANGTRNWDLSDLLASSATFPQLRYVYIKPTDPADHNRSIIGVDYDEDGQMGRLLAKAPVLETLTSPSAPDASFFEVGAHPLRILRVETGYAHQDFLLNLSMSDCFHNLYVLDFGDYKERYMKDYAKECTPFDHYEQLFRSDAFKGVKVFNLRNSVLCTEQIAHLKALRSDLVFYVIEEYGNYLR